MTGNAKSCSYGNKSYVQKVTAGSCVPCNRLQLANKCQLEDWR